MTWVALHEVTHAVQFSGVPWLQGHVAGLVRELLGKAELRMDRERKLRLPSATRSAASPARCAAGIWSRSSPPAPSARRWTGSRP